MIYKTINQLKILLFERFLEYPEIYHFISSRFGGFSPPPFNSLNLGLNVGDDFENVIRNRNLLKSALGLENSILVFCEQIHGGNVAIVKEINHKDKTSSECGLYIEKADAMVTNIPDVCLIVLQADCVPVFFYDPFKKVVGIAHAGWSGTVKTIVINVVNVMTEQYNCLAENIIVGIGPSIGPCCYEVGLEVAKKINPFLIKDNKYYADLWQANKIQLISSGVAERNIEIAGLCTRCNNHMFFSARAANENRTGRFGAGIMIKRNL